MRSMYACVYAVMGKAGLAALQPEPLPFYGLGSVITSHMAMTTVNGVAATFVWDKT